MGSWAWTYRAGWQPTTPRQRAGLHAVKRALIDNGYGQGIVLDAPVFGNTAAKRAREYQAANKLAADGVIGPTTARWLWRAYVKPAENNSGVPNHWLGRIFTLESNNDPVAEGVLDPLDEGIAQLHLPYFPGVTEQQAWNPAFVAPLAANRLKRSRADTGSWKGAVAAWNIGTTYATKWVRAGYPTSGGPMLGDQDAYARASTYVFLVEGRPY